jgi:hypothetical protein
MDGASPAASHILHVRGRSLEGDSTGRASQHWEYPRIENWGSLFDTSLNVDARNVTKPFRAATCQRQRWAGY